MLFRSCSLDDAREGHHRQRDIRNIIKEAAQKTIVDLSFDQQHRYHANHIRSDDGQKDADDDIMPVHIAPPSLQVSTKRQQPR